MIIQVNSNYKDVQADVLFLYLESHKKHEKELRYMTYSCRVTFDIIEIKNGGFV